MNPSGKKISIGTFVMLVVTLLVLIGSAMVLIRLFSGNSVTFSMEDSGKQRTGNKTASGKTSGSSETENRKNSRQSSQIYQANDDGMNQTIVNAGGRFTLTVAGTASLEESIRKSGYISELKIYDFTDVMSLLKNELTSDINIVFLENILTDSTKPSHRLRFTIRMKQSAPRS